MNAALSGSNVDTSFAISKQNSVEEKSFFNNWYSPCSTDLALFCASSFKHPLTTPRTPDGGNALRNMSTECRLGEELTADGLKDYGNHIGRTGSNSICRGALLSRQFGSFWSAFETIHATSVLPIYVDEETGKKYFFDVVMDSVVVREISPRNFTSVFLLTVTVSICVSFTAAAFAVRYTLRAIQRNLLDGIINEAHTKAVTTHRLDLDVGSEAHTPYSPQCLQGV